MMSTKTVNIFLWLILACVVIFLFWRPKEVQIRETITRKDSIVRDTIRDTVFNVTSECVIRYDTIVVNDTVMQYIPISRYEFIDTSYRFVVEGYGVKPILFETYPVTHYIVTERVKEVIRDRRFNHGLNVGIGAMYGTKGIDVGVYVGYGLMVKF